MSWRPEIERLGGTYASAWGGAVDAADPERRVLPRSRALCAGLAVLAREAYRGMGGASEAIAEEVGLAAALLSLVTKVDDQVIDARDFHENLPDEAALRARTWRFLRPTLAAIRRGRAPDHAPGRARLAAELGRRVDALAADPARKAALLGWVARGWQVQVEAVATLTRHASAVTPARVDRATRDISAVWLLLITLVGALPGDVRALTPAEVDAFFRAGRFIQRVDALVDLEKDLADGHRASWPLARLFALDPASYEAGLRAPETLDARLRARRIPDECRAPAAEREAWRAELRGLGDVGGILGWIHEHLWARYEARLRGLG